MGKESKNVWQNMWTKVKDAFEAPPRELTEEEKRANLERRAPKRDNIKKYGIDKVFNPEE